tara:strand:- start:121 stop:336 length:216 start_codon:yes stop_codon:yes gene_type:complete
VGGGGGRGCAICSDKGAAATSERGRRFLIGSGKFSARDSASGACGRILVFICMRRFRSMTVEMPHCKNKWD